MVWPLEVDSCSTGCSISVPSWISLHKASVYYSTIASRKMLDFIITSNTNLCTIFSSQSDPAINRRTKNDAEITFIASCNVCKNKTERILLPSFPPTSFLFRYNQQQHRLQYIHQLHSSNRSTLCSIVLLDNVFQIQTVDRSNYEFWMFYILTKISTFLAA